MQSVFEKIIEKLEEKQDIFLHDDSDYGEGKYNAFDEAIEIVKQEAEQYNNGWIPCSERLPEEHKQYDITTKNEVGIHSDTAIYNPFLGIWFWDEAESKHIEIEVLAWAEKREPYQPNGE